MSLLWSGVLLVNLLPNIYHCPDPSLPIHRLPEKFVKEKLVELHGLQITKTPAASGASMKVTTSLFIS